MKMYILIRESVPPGLAIVAAAHGALAAHLKFKDSPEVARWLAGPFRKVACKVSDEEFERAKKFSDHVVLTESALDNQEVALPSSHARSGRRNSSPCGSIVDTLKFMGMSPKQPRCRPVTADILAGASPVVPAIFPARLRDCAARVLQSMRRSVRGCGFHLPAKHR